MSWATTILIALGLAMDAFAVSIASGLVIKRLTFRHVFRISFHFGLFQALMPILGWLAGTSFASHIEAWDHWVALVLLGFIGGRMLLPSKADEGETQQADPSKGWSLVTLSIATSIDALAVGLSLAMLQVSVWAPAAIIGIVASIMSIVGITFGSRLGRNWGRRAEIVGGLVLVGIGVRIVYTHLTA